MSITAASDAIDLSPSSTSLSGLDGINFFLAGMQAGFGPLVAVLLADEKWTQQNIGYVLSVSGLAGLLSQLPGGELLDASRSKRFLITLGAIVVAVSALVMALWPIPPVVFAALVLQGLTGGVLGPAVAAISLGLVGHAALAERLGRNQRFASAGALIVTGLMGAIGYFLSYRAIFFVSAALVLPLLVAVARVHSADIHFGCSCGQPDHHASTPPPRAKRLSLSKNYNLLTFAACLFLFQFANASMLPLAGERLVYRNGMGASFIVSSLIILPQIVVALSAPWVGQLAQSWGVLTSRTEPADSIWRRALSECSRVSGRVDVRFESKADLGQVDAMSALPPKADIADSDRHVRFVPKADSCTAAIRDLLEQVLTYFCQQVARAVRLRHVVIASRCARYMFFPIQRM